MLDASDAAHGLLPDETADDVRLVTDVSYAALEITGREASGVASRKGDRRAWWARSLLPCLGTSSAPVDLESAFADGDTALAAAKLLVLVFLTIGLSRLIVCGVLDLECDHNYDVWAFISFDMHKVALDLMFLFVVGRLGPRAVLPLDSAFFVAALWLGALVPSLLNELHFMRVSISMYTIFCRWKAQTFVTVGLVLLIAAAIVALHVHHLCRRTPRAERVRFVLELLVVLSIFVLPRVRDPAFHAHHWFTFWVLALVCRFQTTWSRATQAFLLGVYANGIAVYGRDPVFACKTAFHIALDLRCPWLLACTWPAPSNGTHPHPQYRPPDWRSCHPGDYA